MNAWRAVKNLAPIPASQLQSSQYNRADVRVSRSFGLTSNKSVEISLQVLNIFGTDNHIGGTGGAFINGATSSQFGTYTVTSPRQEAEVGARFKF